MTATYDLVQLYPNFKPTLTPAVAYSVADINLDGVVDAFDLLQFVDNYLGELPPADLDMNNSVDEEDLEAFLGAL